MKDYRRRDPLFSLCGLNCALCPMHLSAYCPGCGGGEGHQSCAFIRCSRQRGGEEFCSRCPSFPCERFQEAMAYDSFISHRHMQRDLERAARMGSEAYRAELQEKRAILRRLLAQYNDGRRKSFYCTAVNLLTLSDLQSVMKQLDGASFMDMPLKERATVAVQLLNNLAEERQIDCRLKKKPKKS